MVHISLHETSHLIQEIVTKVVLFNDYLLPIECLPLNHCVIPERVIEISQISDVRDEVLQLYERWYESESIVILPIKEDRRCLHGQILDCLTIHLHDKHESYLMSVTCLI